MYEKMTFSALKVIFRIVKVILSSLKVTFRNVKVTFSGRPLRVYIVLKQENNPLIPLIPHLRAFH